MKKVVFITTIPMFARAFLTGFFRVLNENGYKITLVSNFEDDHQQINFENVELVNIPFNRSVSPYKDLYCLKELIATLNKIKPDVVHTFTPKGGLLGTIASMFLFNCVRYHTFTGQVWVNYTGLRRFFFKGIDKLIGIVTTDVLVDSHSQRRFLIQQKVLSPDKGVVLGEGSISGVRLNKFFIDKDKRCEYRGKYGLSESTITFLFLGRVTEDKGIRELLSAFSMLKNKTTKKVHLFIVGPTEGYVELEKEPCVTFVGYTDTPESFMNMADVFCLPSYREGFGSVIIEAACCGIPSIGSDIYGVSDAIIDNHTGLLHEVKNAESISEKMLNLVEKPELLLKLGQNALERAQTSFSCDHIEKLFLDFYERGSK